MYNQVYDVGRRKLLLVLSHGSIFLSSLIVLVGIPISILFISDDPVVKQNAREAINFHFNVWLYGVIFGLLCLVLIGYPLLAILFIVHWSLPVWAVTRCFGSPNEPCRYPFIFRLL